MKAFKIILGPLTLRNFQFFILGHFISFTGSWIQTTALHWLIYKIRNSTADLGVFVFLTSFPTIFFTLISGLLIDRFDKKRFLQVLLFFALFPPLIMMFLLSWGYYDFWAFLILTFLSSAIAAIDMPLRQVFISEIVPSFYLTKALSLQAISFNTARMLGPAMAGYLIQHFSIMFCFFLNAISFLLMLVLIQFISPTSKSNNIKRKIEICSEIKEFYLVIKVNRKILITLVILSNFTLLATSIIILLPMLVQQVLKGSVKDFAYLSSGIGLGAIFGGILVFLQKELKKKLEYLLFAHFIWAMGILCFISGSSFLWFYTGALLIGISFTSFFPVVNAFLQNNAPFEHKGKVMSLFSLIFFSMAPLGQSFVGYLGEFVPYKLLLLCIMFFLCFLNTLLILYTVSREDIENFIEFIRKLSEIKEKKKRKEKR